MGMLKEFKDFAMRGNVVDLAVGVIIGAAFGKIVSSMVNDVLMPPIGMLMGSVNFSDLYISLDPSRTAGLSLGQAKEIGAPVVAYGAFINAVLDFTIVAFGIFLVVKVMNRLKNPVGPEPATTRECPLCISRIPIKATRCAFCTAEVPRVDF